MLPFAVLSAQPVPNRQPLRRLASLLRTSLALAAGLAGAWSMTSCGSAVSWRQASRSVAIAGNVHGGQQPVTASQIHLYTVSTTANGLAGIDLLSAPVYTSDGTGIPGTTGNASNGFNSFPAGDFNFSSYVCPASDPDIYIVAVGGNSGFGTANSSIALMAALGDCNSLNSFTYVSMNELTTVASVAALYPYMVAQDSYKNIGYQETGAGNDMAAFDAAWSSVQEYVNTATGQVPGPSLPSGMYASSLEIAALGDALGPCINSDGSTAAGAPCQQLFSLATPPAPGSLAPFDTISAAIDILTNPNNNTCAIWNLAPPQAVYQPYTPNCPPNGWVFPIEPVVATPQFSEPAGSYTSPFAFNITDSTVDSTIYYTTDGTTPSFNPSTGAPTGTTTECLPKTSTSTGLCTITGVISGETVKAIATAPNEEFSGYTSAGIASVVYIVNPTTGPAQLVFQVQPNNTPTSTAMTPAVTVLVEDSNGNIVSGANNPVLLSLVLPPGGMAANLSNGGPIAAMNGVATFPALSVDTIQNGYTFTATSTGLASATSTAFNITYPLLTIAPATPTPVANNLVGTGKTLPGQVCIPSALASGSPALVVNLASSVPADVAISTSPATVTFPAGSPANTCEPFSYTGGTIGASTLTASATGYVPASMQITATNALVSLGQLSTVAPNQTSQIALSLGTTAPAEVNGQPLEVTMTEVNLTGTALVAPAMVPIYPGLQVPQQNPTITGNTFGQVWVFATAPNYAGDAALVNVTETATMPAAETIPVGQTTNVVLTLSAPAVAGMSFNITSSAPTSQIVLPSPNVPIAAGSTTVNIPITGQGLTSTPATVTATCTCYSSVTASTQVTVAGSFTSSTATTGNQLYSPVTGNLTVAPASPVDVTVTSQNSNVALVSKVSTALGTVAAGNTSQIVFSSINSTSIPTFYIQGLATGSTTLTYQATGYASSNVTLTVLPSGFVLLTQNENGLPFTTTTQSSTTPIYVDLVMLNTSGTVYEDCTYFGVCGLLPGVNPNVQVMSKTATVGTVPATPISFSGAAVEESTPFTPVGPGTTAISIPAQPAGFTASTDPTVLNSMVTVTAPALTVNGSITTGQGLYVSGGQVGLQVAPHSAAVNVQLSVPLGCGALLTSNSSQVGSNVLTFTGINSTSTPTFYVQGQNVGQGQAAVNCVLNVTATGYTSANGNITVDPSGFVLQGQNLQNGIITTTFSSPSPVDLTAAILNSPSLTVNQVCSYFSACAINPGTGPINVVVSTTGAPADPVGNIGNSPAVYNPGSTDVTLNFVPAGKGMTQISVGAQPAGFYATTSAFNPNNYYATTGLMATATVTAPQINFSGNWAGVGLQSQLNPNLPVAPPAPVTVTICSDNPAALVLSYNNTTLGTSSPAPCNGVSPSSTLTFTNVNSTNIPAIYQQGIAKGSANIYVSAPGYSTGMGNSAVLASGFVFGYPGYQTGPVFNTTTFSSPTNIDVSVALLDSSLNVFSAEAQTLNPYPTVACAMAPCPPVGPFSIAVTSSNTGVGTISGSPVVFAAGDNTHTITFQPLTAGTSNLAVGAQPTGFSTPAQSSVLNGTATVTAPQITLGGGYTGAGMYIGLPGPNLGATPPSPITVTITSNNPASVLISTDPTQVGTAQIVLTNVTSAGLPTIYCQGQPLGGQASTSSTLTVSAPGYQSGSAGITVYPSGFVFGSNGYPGGPNIQTTPFSSPSTIYVTATLLTPGTLAYYGNYYGPNAINPGTGPFIVPIALADSGTAAGNIGTLSGNAVFTSGTASTSITFTPNVNAGAVLTEPITLTQPAGFTATSSVNSPNDLAGSVTLTPPQISIGTTGTTGAGLYITGNSNLTQAPPSAVPVKVQVADPTVVVISSDQTMVGTGVINFPSVTTAAIPQFYIQGQPLGGATSKSTTITVSAPGYTSAQTTINVYPSGFVFDGSPNISTTPYSSTQLIYLTPAVLDPNTLAVANVGTYGGLCINYGCYVNPGSGPFNLQIGSTNPTAGVNGVGLLSNGGIAVFNSDTDYTTLTFTPNPNATTTQTTTFSLGAQPAGFMTTTSTTNPNDSTGTATITPPGMTLYGVTTGVGVAVGSNVFLQQEAPASVGTVTVHVSIASGTGSALIALSPTGVGAAAQDLMIPQNNTQSPTFYIQGTGAGSATITATASGYAQVMATETIDDTGFIFTSGLPITTTTISQPTNLTIEPALITPGTLAVVYSGYGVGCGNVGCVLVNAAAINLNSSEPSVGTVTGVVNFAAGSYYATATFTPLSTGGAASATTTVSIPAQPAGFTQTSSTNSTTYLSGVATVTAPAIDTVSSTVTTGVGLQVPLTFNLAQVSNNVNGATITVTSSNPAVVQVSNAAGTAGTAPAVFNGVTTTANQTVYVQGIATGTATLTFTSLGYQSATVMVTVDPGGFVISTSAITAKAGGANVPVSVQPAILTAGTLDFVGYALLSPGQGTLAIPINVQTAGCGSFQPSGGGSTVTTLTLNFNSNDTVNGGDSLQTATYVPPGAACSTNLILVGPYPGGFSFPAQQYEVGVTVNP